MRIFWLSCMVISALLLLVILIRQPNTRGWLKRFGLHLTAAAIVLYLLNFSGVIAGFEVPLNPVTLGTVVLLGLPGIALVLGLQLALF